jgi:hypothetical protein
MYKFVKYTNKLKNLNNQFTGGGIIGPGGAGGPVAPEGPGGAGVAGGPVGPVGPVGPGGPGGPIAPIGALQPPPLILGVGPPGPIPVVPQYQPVILADPSGARGQLVGNPRLIAILEDFFWELTNENPPVRRQLMIQILWANPGNHNIQLANFLENRVNLNDVWVHLTNATKIDLFNLWFYSTGYNSPDRDAMVHFINNL